MIQTKHSLVSMRYGDTVLAERRGPIRQGSVFYLAKVTCVIYFDILHDDNPSINKTPQDDILSYVTTMNKGSHSSNTTTSEPTADQVMTLQGGGKCCTNPRPQSG